MNLMNKIKVKILGYRATSESYITYLRKIGVQVGEDVVLYRPLHTTIDVQNPHLLEIGNHVMMTGPVTILTHDYSWSVLKRKYGEIVGNQKYTVLKDNIFIGWGATILAGSYIGENTIIGAGSVVSGHLDGNAVYAGNPARRILSINEYYQKRKRKQLEEAATYVRKYEERFGVVPSIEELDEYFFLFFNPNDQIQRDTFDFKLKLMENYNETMKKAELNKPPFSSYDEFIKYCKENR